MRAAFARGELSYCKVRALSRVATPETEAGLLEIARHATGAQLEKLVRCYAGALSATLGTAQRAHDLRYLKWSWNDDGSLRLEGRLPAAEGGLVDEGAGGVRGSSRRTEDAYAPSPVAACRADALVAMARAAVAGSAGRTVARSDVRWSCTSTRRRWRRRRSSSAADLADGPALAPETVRRLGCDASVVRIVERDGRPLTVGRRTRTIPPALRRALRSRDDGCRFPGCTHERYLHAHHIGHWARGGRRRWRTWFSCARTTTGWCTRAGSRSSAGGGGSVRFRRPDGRVIAAPRRWRGRRAGRGWRSSTGRAGWWWIRTRAGRCRRGIGWTMTWRWMRCCLGRSLR